LNRIKVKAHTNWCDDVTLREHLNRCCPQGDYIWKDIELTLSHRYDFFVIFNFPRHPFFDPQKTIVLNAETKTTRDHIKKKAYTLFGFDPGKNYFFVFDTNQYHSVDKWFHSRTYADIAKSDFSKNKTKLMSGIVSGNNALLGHKLRLNMVRELNNLEGYDHFGRGDFSQMKHYLGPLENKEEGIIPYKYHFNCENDFEQGYFTEKFLDALFFESLIFYDGCTNMNDFFDPESYVKIDITQPAASFDIIQKSIKDKLWEQRLPAIKRAKDRALNDYNPMEIIWEIIHGKI